MVNNMKRKLFVGMLSLGLVFSIAMMLNTTDAAEGTPGSIDDPLVTKSYIDDQIAILKEKFEELLKSGTNGSGTGSSINNMTEIYEYIDNKLEAIVDNGVDVSTGYTVIKVEPKKKVIAEASAEIIVRSGETKAIGNEGGDGLSDVTEGMDVKHDMDIMNNHLLIVPRTDGRGLFVVKESYIMIKGNYMIK